MAIQQKIVELFKDSAELSALAEVIRHEGKPFWLVGGCLRDLFLNRPITDLDIICSTDPTHLAQQWASQVNGRWFWLDSGRLQSRVLLKKSIHIDFSPLRAENLIRDLELRDFTINSMALQIPVDDGSVLVDPIDGLSDLKKKQLKMSSAQSYADDPLRMIKGIRHAIILNLKFVPESFSSIKVSAKNISRVPGERIREELLQILLSADPIRGIDLLYASGLLDQLIKPRTATKNWSPLLEQLKLFSKKLTHLNHSCETNLLESGIICGFSNKALFFLVKLLEHYPSEDISLLLHKTLRMSRREQMLVEQLLVGNQVEKKLQDLLRCGMSQRRTALVVERLEPFSIEKILYWGVCRDKIEYSQALGVYGMYLHEQKHGRVPDLLTGHELKNMIKPVNSSQVGNWQKKIKQAEIDGIISARREAEEWLKKQITD